MAKQKAELFADGFLKGRAAGMKDARRLVRSSAYARKRVAYLAHWRKYAIDRLGIGTELVEEIDKAAKSAVRGVRFSEGKSGDGK